jgi:hypothetical protein
VLVVESSGFVTRSAKELLGVAVGGVCSFNEDISQVDDELSGQVVNRQSRAQISQCREEKCSRRSEALAGRVKLVVFKSI